MQLLRTSRIFEATLVCVVLVFAPASLFAESESNARESLVAKIEEEADNFSTPPDQTIVDYQDELRAGLNDLDEYLKRGTPAERDGWRAYLNWDELSSLTKGEPNGDALKDRQEALRAGHPGLERPSFVRVRKVIDKLRVSSVARQFPDNFRKPYATRVRQLAKLVGDPNADFGSINQSIATLKPLGLPTEIEAAIRGQFVLPNLRVLADGEFLANTYTRPIWHSTPVSETLLGTRFSGTSTTTGTARIRLIPSKDSARFCLLFDGQTVSDACGTQRPVQVSSRSVTQAQAWKRVTLDENGFYSDAATASCSTRSRVRWIRSMRRFGSRLIEKVAYRKAEQQRPLAQRIASRRAEKRINKMMDEQTSILLGRMNGRFRNRFRPRLAQRSIYPRWVHYSTSSQQLCIQALQGTNDQLGAPTVPPTMPKYSVSIQIHETFPGNTAASFMSGLNLTAAMATELAEKMAGSVPNEMQEEKDWSVLFDLQNPVSLSFRDNGVKVAMTARRFSRGSDSLNRVMEISATYQIEEIDGKYVLRRSPEIDVAFPGNESARLGVRDIAQRDLMQRVFASVFGEQFSSDSLRIPEQFEKMKDLQLQYISSENGWLSLGWN